jgi:hypothetical protein
MHKFLVEHKNKYPLVLGTLMFGSVIYFGFGSHKDIISSCNMKVDTFVKAEFSETTTVMNADGTSSTDTDYWSEKASVVYKSLFKNGEIISSSMPQEKITEMLNTGIQPYPSIIHSFRSDRHFDRYSKKRIIDGKTSFSSGDYVTSKSYDDYNNCMKRLNEETTVKTWYGISYNIENT